jgi:hypothetical protein
MTDHAVAVVAMVFGGVSAVTAIIAVIYAHLANNKSSRANAIASDAKVFAAAANDIAARGEAREVEPHDVHWEGSWDPRQPGRYLLRKRGNTEARDVRASVSYHGDEQVVIKASMAEDGATLVFEFRGALRDYQDEYAERQYAANSAAAGILTAGHVMRTYPVRERVAWLTPLGTPKLHDKQQPDHLHEVLPTVIPAGARLLQRAEPPGRVR